jgi:mono/diheme cytochrome c family protein
MLSKAVRIAVAAMACVAAAGLVACGDSGSDQSAAVTLTKKAIDPQNGDTPGAPSTDGMTNQPTDASTPSTPDATTTTTSTDSPATPAGGGSSGAANAAGKAIFTQTCSSCHTLADAGATGQVGPDLDKTSLDLAAIIAKVTKGGGGMPTFGGTLPPGDIKNVASYVSSVKSG